MENNNNENVNVNENEKSVDDFIQEVNDLKANSVSKEEYNKVVEEKKTLMKALIDGNTDGLDLPTNNSNDDIEKRIKENRNKLAKGEVANDLEYWQTVLQLREDVIETRGEEHDPFLPNGHEYLYDENDARSANRVAEVVQQCIDSSEGDPEIFRNELMRRTKDTAPSKPKPTFKR